MVKQDGSKQMVWKLSSLTGWIRFGMLSGLVLSLLHCSGGQEVLKKGQQPTGLLNRYDESFDPLTLNDDDLVITPDTMHTSIGTAETGSNQQAPGLIPNETEGFRVQIMATNNIGSASLTEQEASARFGSLGHKVYLVFEAPLYKIRVGDCVERNVAEELRDKAKDFGYTNAFIVKTKINPGK